MSPTVHVTAEEIRHLAGIGPKTNVFAVDLRQVAARVRRHPWIASATAHRRLPNAIRLVVREEEAVAAVLIEGHEKGDSHLYLVNADGRPFKRALPAELEGLPVVTGVTRADYRRQKAQVVARVREALHAYRTYVSQPGRPRLGELHWDPVEGLTLYTAERGTQVRLGRGPVGPKLRRLDRVLGALAERGQRANVVRLDNARQPERVVVRLAEAEAPR